MVTVAAALEDVADGCAITVVAAGSFNAVAAVAMAGIDEAGPGAEEKVRVDPFWVILLASFLGRGVVEEVMVRESMAMMLGDWASSSAASGEVETTAASGLKCASVVDSE